MQLKDRHILVTGAAKRVGRAIAECLLDPARGPGVRLTAHYHQSETNARDLAATLKKRGRESHLVSADLRDPKALAAAMDSAVARFGPVDILVNSASAFYPTPANTVTPAQWDELLDTNLKGHFFLAQSFHRQLGNRPGVIVNIADVNGEIGMKRHAPYSAAKGGLLALTRTLALEWAPRVRVNAVSPGPVLLPESYSEAQRRRSVERTLLGRVGSASDVALAVLFLVENDYVTGMNLRVDGGRSLAGHGKAPEEAL